MDLSDDQVQRDIAKHIAALANYGGGYLIFGFNDGDLSPDVVVPLDFRSTYNHDFINGAVVLKYLEPPIHCDVFTMQRAAGTTHVIVCVPSHGATPICLRRGGTTHDGDATGRLEKDTYYVRKPGPRSEPITQAMEWKPILQRCVLFEREHLLAAVKVIADAFSAVTREREAIPMPRSSGAADIGKASEEAFLNNVSSEVKNG